MAIYLDYLFVLLLSISGLLPTWSLKSCIVRSLLVVSSLILLFCIFSTVSLLASQTSLGSSNTGIALSLNNDVNIGDIVLSTDVLHHDMDAIGFGYKKGQIPQMDEFSFPADEKLRKLAAKVCKEVNPEISVFEGRICSGDQFISDKSVKDAIISEFGGFAVEMEGAAIGQAAYLNHIPFLVVRAISDKADGSAHMDYAEFEMAAIEHSVKLTVRMIQEL